MHTSNKEQRDSMDMLWYGHKYGFVPDKDFELLWHECKLRYPITRMTSGRWGKKFEEKGKIWDWDSYNKKCKVAHAKFLFSTSKAFSQDWRLAYINDLSLFGPSAVVEGAPERFFGLLHEQMDEQSRREKGFAHRRKAVRVEKI